LKQVEYSFKTICRAAQGPRVDSLSHSHFFRVSNTGTSSSASRGHAEAVQPSTRKELENGMGLSSGSRRFFLNPLADQQPRQPIENFLQYCFAQTGR
jgi:phage tail protein X